jgi:hypothetical protein
MLNRKALLQGWLHKRQLKRKERREKKASALVQEADNRATQMVEEAKPKRRRC